MDSGKVSESVLKRSVLKYVQQNHNQVTSANFLERPITVGVDAAFWQSPVSGAATGVAVGRHPMVAVEAIINACNNLACGSAEAFGVELSLVLPEAMYESELRHIMEAVKDYTVAHQIVILGGHTTVSKSVTEAVVTAVALGCGKTYYPQMPKPGMDVVMTKWIGLQGTAKIAKEQKEALLERLPARFVAEASTYCKYMSIVPEAAIAWEAGAAAMHDVSGGGIFRALWELAEYTGTGIRIDLKSIPVKQETVEVCEVFGLNPYEILSGGALLIVAENGQAMVEKLLENGIPAKMIGKLTDDNDRVLVTHTEEGEELRYLERPKTDEIDKIVDTVSQ